MSSNNFTPSPSSAAILSKIGAPDYESLQDMQDVLNSTGAISGGAISNNGDGTAHLSAGQGLIRGVDSPIGSLYFCKWDISSSVVLTDNSINYISLQFVDASTDPAVVVTTTKPTDLHTNILRATVYRSGVEIHVSNEAKIDVPSSATLMIQRLSETEPFIRVDGGILSEVGTRQIKSTAGNWWEGLNRFSTIEQDTSGASPDNNHTFECFYQDALDAWITHEEAVAATAFTGVGLDDATSGGTYVGSHTIRIHVEIDSTGATDTFKWSYKDNDGVTTIETTGVLITGAAQALIDGATISFAAITGHTLGDAWSFDATLSNQINNTQYNDPTGGLSILGNSRFGLHWVYLDNHGHLAVLFGKGSYTLTDAQVEAPPSVVPDEFEVHARLIGRIIIAKDAAVFESIENNYILGFENAS